MRAKLLTRMCLIVYIIVVMCFILVGQLSGNLSITTSMQVSLAEL